MWKRWPLFGGQLEILGPACQFGEVPCFAANPHALLSHCRSAIDKVDFYIRFEAFAQSIMPGGVFRLTAEGPHHHDREMPEVGLRHLIECFIHRLSKDLLVARRIAIISRQSRCFHSGLHHWFGHNVIVQQDRSRLRGQLPSVGGLTRSRWSTDHMQGIPIRSHSATKALLALMEI